MMGTVIELKFASYFSPNLHIDRTIINGYHWRILGESVHDKLTLEMGSGVFFDPREMKRVIML